MANYRDFIQHADETALTLTRSSQNWMAFLTTAARLYKYPYHEQLMIYSQRPDAIACAEFDIWNKRMGRYIKRGSKGIMISDGKQARYVFDIADTGARPKSRPFKLWEYSAEYDDVVQKMFAEKYGSKNKIFFNMVDDAVRQSAAEYWADNRRNIIDIVANSFLEGYDSYNIKVKFIDAVRVSATYAVLSRCGFEPDAYFDREDFLNIFDFNTVDTISELGSATSEINQQILRNIEITIKNYERAKLAERTENNGRTDLHETRGLLSPEPDLSRNQADIRQVRNDEGGLSETPQDRSVEQTDTPRRADTAPQRDRQDSARTNRSDDAGTDEVSGSDGGIESDRPTQMGGLGEQLQGAGRGNNPVRTGLQLSLFPTEEEQIEMIDEAESKNELPFAFSISDTDFENLLRTGSNTDNARMIIAAEFSKDKGLDSNADFLRNIYHGGYGIKGEIDNFAAWYGEDGIHINRGSTARYAGNAQLYSWKDAAEKIARMLDNGTFASNVELVEAPGFERKQISESLWYLYHDLADSAREQGYLLSLQVETRSGFPDETAELAEKLNIPEYRDRVAAELVTFITDYENDKSIMRFHYHKPRELLGKLEELATERSVYTSELAEIPEVPAFITEDEIDMNLSGGSHFEGGRGRIYEYFTAEHSLPDKINFLKNEYGTGGSSHALSGASSSFEDHSPKGISLKKNSCTTVQMSWNNVAKRITELVRTDRYFTPEARRQYEESKRSKAFNGLYGEYTAIKEAHPNDMVLFQVGDFFEMFGEDAKAAADVLDIRVTGRTIEGVGRVDMCGIPGFTLEQNVEKLREQSGVTISAIDSGSNERRTYSLEMAVSEIAPKTEITQADIEAFIKEWNGDIVSKQRVNEYMREHGRERSAAARVSYEGLAPVDLPWTKVQRTLIQMVSSDAFLDENERVTENDIKQSAEENVEENIEAIPEETAEQVSDVETEDYNKYIGRELEIDDRRFVVERINDLFETVGLRDITFQNGTGFPIFRNESLEWLKRVMDLQEYSNEPVTAETVAVYPAEENNLPYDIVIEKIPSDAPTPEVGNFHITDDHLGEGGAKTKFRANMDAINLLKTLELEGRQATEDEQEILSRYVGWGSLPDAFDESKEAWADEFTELYTALSPEEYKAAKASVLNAHYTSPTVIRAMYEAIENMGFSKGNILDITVPRLIQNMTEKVA